MPLEVPTSLRHLTDEELVARVKSLAARARGATALLVAHLAELDTRDVHLRAGFSSLFAYCRAELALSEAEAYNRIEVARAARRYPVILERLGAGALNLTTVRLLAPHLTAENHSQVLESARGKGKAEVEEIVARLAPRPDVVASLRRLPAPREVPPERPGSPSLPPAASPSPISIRVETIRITAQPPPSRPVVAPLAPDRYRLQLTIGGDTLEKLRLAKDLLRHAIPSGDDAAILDRALTALLIELARKKFAATDAPGASRGPTPGSRHIPAEVRRAVWLRDLGRCAFVGKDGRRCAERAFVEFHHLKPYASGGDATVSNIQLRCRRHNDYEARAWFGGGAVGPAAAARRSGAPKTAPQPP